MTIDSLTCCQESIKYVIIIKLFDITVLCYSFCILFYYMSHSFILKLLIIVYVDINLCITLLFLDYVELDYYT